MIEIILPGTLMPEHKMQIEGYARIVGDNEPRLPMYNAVLYCDHGYVPLPSTKMKILSYSQNALKENVRPQEIFFELGEIDFDLFRIRNSVPIYKIFDCLEGERDEYLEVEPDGERIRVTVKAKATLLLDRFGAIYALSKSDISMLKELIGNVAETIEV